MRLFRGRFPFDKFTDEKFRWNLDVDGVGFKVYITQERVPIPAPKVIDVIVLVPPENWYTYQLTRLGAKTVGQLSAQDEADLETIGLPQGELRAAGSDSIFGAVQRADDEHTETVRYNAIRASKNSEFGDPYVPKSLFVGPYPPRLLFLVQWIN
jgi:hypothetical protein